MPRRPRLATGDLAYHSPEWRIGRLTLFKTPADYHAFETILADAYAATPIRIAAYWLMPNHWHLLPWPSRDGELSEILRWITVTHTQRWHAQHQTAGAGPVYQGRFKSFPVQIDEHFLTVARYIERNALRAHLVTRAEAWGSGDSLAAHTRRPGLRRLAERLASGPASRLGGPGESAADGLGAGGPPDQRPTGPAVWGRAMGAADGEALWDGIDPRPPGRPNGS